MNGPRNEMSKAGEQCAFTFLVNGGIAFHSRLWDFVLMQ